MPDEAGNVKATPKKLVIHAASEGFGQEPPRLLAGLFDVKCDDPEDTVYYQKKTPVSGAAPSAPKPDGGGADKGNQVTDPGMIKKILQHVVKQLKTDYKDLWETQKAQAKLWTDDDTGPDETWARRFTERFFGATYGGPGQAYFSNGIWDTYIFSRVQPKTRPVLPYLEGHRDGTREIRNSFRIDNWQTPDQWKNPPADPSDASSTLTLPLPKKPADADWAKLIDWVDNDDPAISIVISCQQTSSYMAVTRGFSVEDHLGGAGFAASENSQKLPLFTGTPVSAAQKITQKGTFYTLGSFLANGQQIGNVYAPLNMSQLLRVSYSMDEKNLKPTLGVGTIITYNPHGFTPKDTIKVALTLFEQDPGQLMRVRATVCRELRGHFSTADQESTCSYSEPRTAPFPDWTAVAAMKYVKTPRRKTESPEAADARRATEEQAFEAKKASWLADKTTHETMLQLSNNVQDPGSHICAVLRVMKADKPEARRLQLFDTSSNAAYWVLETQARRGLTVRPLQGGIMDGSAIPSDYPSGLPQIPCGTTVCTGVGVLGDPDAKALTDQIAALEKARPVGLCRLVVSLRKQPPAAIAKFLAKANPGTDLGPNMNFYQYNPAIGPQIGDVLYVSRLLRMYGDDPGENYYISRLLWSLRATPFYSNVQPWWFLFVPTGLLAKSMWAQGARKVTPAEFKKTVIPSYPPKPKPEGKGQDDPFPPRKAGEDHDLRFPQHYFMSHVLTNCGSESVDRAGKPVVWARFKSSMADSGSTTRGVDGYAPPSAFVKKMEFLLPGEEFVAKDFGVTEVVGKDDSDLSWFYNG